MDCFFYSLEQMQTLLFMNLCCLDRNFYYDKTKKKCLRREIVLFGLTSVSLFTFKVPPVSSESEKESRNEDDIKITKAVPPHITQESWKKDVFAAGTQQSCQANQLHTQTEVCQWLQEYFDPLRSFENVALRFSDETTCDGKSQINQ